MSDSADRVVPPIWNVPNILTFARIIFAILLFVVVPLGWYVTALALFLIGSLTDFLDGWWARKFHQVTKLGRIADPFADKFLVCGTMIYLVAIPELRVPVESLGGLNVGVAPWMVVLIVSRELLVTLLRSMVESTGGDFSAKWAGKLKMASQCFAICACFGYLIARQQGVESLPLKYSMVGSLWLTVILTLESGGRYVFAAIRASRGVNKGTP